MNSVVTYADAVKLAGRDVRLEPMRSEHAEGLFAASRERSIWDYLPTDWPTTVDEMRHWMDGALAQHAAGNRVPFTVIDAKTGGVIGSTSYLDISEPDRHIEIGWTWYAPAYQRSRVNTECKYLLLRHAFETLGCIRVQLRTDLRNERSQRAIERIGGVREGTLRHLQIIHGGHRRSVVFYSLLADEWPQRKAWFEERLSVDE
jgi:RimJ/RimL family protein N-acetyltransferase